MSILEKVFGKNTAFNTLQKVVDEFSKKGLAREVKINDRIQALTVEAQELKDEINLKTQQLVDAEIDEDMEAQDKLTKEITNLRQRLDDTESKLNAYQSTFKTPGLSYGEIRKLTDAVILTRQNRQQQGKDIEGKIQAAYDQIQTLTDEINRMREEKAILDQPKEALLVMPVMKYIHPEFRNPEYEKKLGEYQYSFEQWLIKQNV